jgi:type II secretory pathway pseudopilin PulG
MDAPRNGHASGTASAAFRPVALASAPTSAARVGQDSANNPVAEETMPRFPRHPAARMRSAFTLMELMVVIGIMVLMLALAVPTFNVMTGSRSIENAQNAIAATLAQARLSAVRSQAPRGVCFYRDPATDRIAMALVSYDTGNTGIEVVPETDAQFLPKGVDVGFRHNIGPGASDYVYRIPSGQNPENLRGLILFDAKGHIAYRSYGIGDDTEIERRMGASGPVGSYPNATYPFYSQPAFLLADRSAVDDASDKEKYFNDYATVVLVNRYNGTLTRSE